MALVDAWETQYNQFAKVLLVIIELSLDLNLAAHISLKTSLCRYKINQIQLESD